MMLRVLAAFAALVLYGLPAHAADLDVCAQHLPYGAPTIIGQADITVMCKRGFVVAHDNDALIPRWVAYRLRAEDTFGCVQRRNNFHADDALPSDHRSTPRDYAKSGYDKGHMKPAADAASSAEMDDTFLMSNMSPQRGGLNRQQWEHLEEATRAWAWQRNEVLVIVGPVLSDAPRHIGHNRVAVPSAFFKAIIDPEMQQAIAFEMPNKAVKKGKLDPWQVAVADVERDTDLSLPLPDGVDRDGKAPLWSADVKGWNAKHRAECAH